MKSNLLIFFVTFLYFLPMLAAEGHFVKIKKGSFVEEWMPSEKHLKSLNKLGFAEESDADNILGYLDQIPEPDDMYEIYDGLLDEIKEIHAALQKENIKKAENFAQAVAYRILYKIPAIRYESSRIRLEFNTWAKNQMSKKHKQISVLAPHTNIDPLSYSPFKKPSN